MKHPTLCIAALLGVSLLSLWLGAELYHLSPFYMRVNKAEAIIHPTKGNQVSGTVRFEHKKDGLHISAVVNGLTPGKHGFHIHEWGDCSCEDASCAGAHFNPTNQPHAGPTESERHVGDLGNIVANENGVGTYKFVDTDATLNGRNSIIGRSVIVHADPDDLKTQPSGNAGARIGCGVIGIAQ